MIRDLGSGPFGKDPYADQEEADPRVGLVNLADVMLVFACGLMVALVAHWNVDLQLDQVDETSIERLDDVQDIIDEMKSGGGGYDERGRVYEDPSTGQLYLLSEESGEEGESDGS